MREKEGSATRDGKAGSRPAHDEGLGNQKFLAPKEEAMCLARSGWGHRNQKCYLICALKNLCRKKLHRVQSFFSRRQTWVRRKACTVGKKNRRRVPLGDRLQGDLISTEEKKNPPPHRRGRAKVRSSEKETLAKGKKAADNNDLSRVDAFRAGGAYQEFIKRHQM